MTDDPDPAWLDAIELEMAGHGVAVAAARLDALARLQNEIDERPEGAFPQADLGLDGMVEADLSEGMTASEAEDRFLQALRDGRALDASVGRTLTRGPHRTELAARHREKDQAAAECSTGEQKALILTLVLAQSRALARLRGQTPLLLLDEACAHLDQRRRGELGARDTRYGHTGVDDRCRGQPVRCLPGSRAILQGRGW